METKTSALQQNAALREQVAHTGVEFLFTELGTALTFARVAETSLGDVQKLERNRANARKAYDTLLSFSAKLPMDDDARSKINEGVHKLRSKLERLGEEF